MDTKFIITLAVGLALQAAAGVWWLATMSAKVQHNDFQIQMISKDVSKNSSFVELWPAGKWGSGSLPSDVRQDLKIANLEMQMQKLNEKIYNGGFKNDSHCSTGKNGLKAFVWQGVDAYHRWLCFKSFVRQIVYDRNASYYCHFR